MTDLSGAILLPDGCRVRGRGRLRRWHRPYDGARNLVDAALETGAERFVQESIAFIYPDRGDAWIDEDVPLYPPALGRANQAAEAEAARFTGTGRGCGAALRAVLRLGIRAHPVHARMARRRLPALPGDKSAYAPAIAADDDAADKGGILESSPLEESPSWIVRNCATVRHH